ncbi:CRISPR-associated protein Cas4 [Christensenella tenuis]|jgi:CRISPR-associated exonuclease Cas4|uniref:CRISPR-associated exonuclease Cas4 n=1 Tax=Christensenella tenuis TaxID=2763033 RepID=A0ABR7EG41_9FIRM|nr:CRISPR-associated protein Cas4 [Christensenella tenuis]MBC5648109.1 CRISPR-associated protein Cas4 [Christensenella tenuis]
MTYREEDYLLLSGIQHYAFCPRQWALIHVEEQWSENYLTAGGRIMHTKAHGGNDVEKRGGLIIFRALKVRSAELGVSGECDVVEFRKSKNGISLRGYPGLWLPYPVEYKRGKTKLDDCDRLQLCAQAVCLEEMLCTKIEEGALFYGEPRKREIVSFTPVLRGELDKTVQAMHELFSRKHTPEAVKKKHCQSCSIKDICLPGLSQKSGNSAKKYMEAHIE